MVFCVDLSRGRWPSQVVCTWLLLKHPGMSRRQEKRRIKEGPTTMRIGVCHQIPHYGLHADGLLWACYLRPAASSRTYSAASSWTHLHPLIAQDRPRCSCPSASDHRNDVQRDCCRFLVVTIPTLRNSCFFLSFLSLTFPSPSPQSIIVSILPFLRLRY